MARMLLQDKVEATPYEWLPANWSSFDLKSFSRQKQLWDYQQQAVASAVAGLWKYYEEFADCRRGETIPQMVLGQRSADSHEPAVGVPAPFLVELARGVLHTPSGRVPRLCLTDRRANDAI